jgi:hypothetical protein
MISTCTLAVLLLATTGDALQQGAAARSRRAFLGSVSVALGVPAIASAGIDVSGLSVDGGAGGNTILREQLKSYDGSGASRIQDIKAASPASAASTMVRPEPLAETPSNIATYALRYGDYTRLKKAGFGERYLLEDYVVGPGNSRVSVSFEFPSDWLQLDKISGGIQYVDQRNGDKLYVLKATLPEGTTLATAPKTFFADAIFDVQGSISRSGTTIDEFRASRSEMLQDTRRRLTMKYYTVTGNGLRVERRALVDVQNVGQDVYMLMTSSNAAKFEAKGRERETVEAIVDSFRCDRV